MPLIKDIKATNALELILLSHQCLQSLSYSPIDMGYYQLVVGCSCGCGMMSWCNVGGVVVLTGA